MSSSSSSSQLSQRPTAYMSGFGNEFESEAPGYEGALPKGLINPQKCAYDLFAEQLSGTAFTAPRHTNRRSWLYRLWPSVGHKSFERYGKAKGLTFTGGFSDPNQQRWLPFEPEPEPNGAVASELTDFVDGLRTLAYSDVTGLAESSVAIHIYLANANMVNRTFLNGDSDFLIVAQLGSLVIRTEFGMLNVAPGEIAVIQRGMHFAVDLEKQNKEGKIRGYILEVKGNHFELPQLGAIGANCLANPRDFQAPMAAIDEKPKLESKHEIIMKFKNKLYSTHQDHSPFCVAAWFGNYTPYKYNLSNFVSLNTVSVDHPDPSIFTVLSCPSIGKVGTSLADFVIFPPRWECANGTFRPPYFHRNCMTEFMGLISGQYQAKSGEFAPGGASLHHAMTAHGPDFVSHKRGVEQDTSVPTRVADGGMAFMFETCHTLKLSEWAMRYNRDTNYLDCWAEFDIKE